MRKLSFIFASLLLVVNHVCTRSESNQIKLSGQKQRQFRYESVIRPSLRPGICSQGTQFTGSIGSIMGSKRD